MSGFGAIVRMTVLELRRQRSFVFGVLIALAVMLIALKVPVPTPANLRELFGNLPPSEAVTVEQALRFHALSALSTFRLFAVIIAVTVGAGLIAEEMSRGTVLLLATRPIRRSTIVLGKYAGALLVACAWLLVWTASYALIVGGRASSTLPLTVGAQLAAGSMLVVALMLAIAMTMSVVLGSRMAMVMTILLWIVTNAAETVAAFFGKGPHAAEGAQPTGEFVEQYSWLGDLANGFGYVVPKQQLEAWANSLAGEMPAGLAAVTAEPDTTRTIAGAVAILAWVALATVLFARRRNLA